MDNLKCESCDQIFANGSNLRRHKRTFHTGEKIFECTQCDKKFGRSDSLSRHIYRHNNKAERYTCNVNGCKRSFTQLQKLEEHRNNHVKKLSEDVILIKGYTVQKINGDESTSFICPIENCSRIYTSYAGMVKHITLHEDPEKRLSFKTKTYVCEKCGKTFDKNKRLLVHSAKHHENDFSSDEQGGGTVADRKVYVCQYDECKRIFTRKSNLSMHEKTFHVEEKGFRCDACSSSFRWKKSLKLHKCKMEN